MAGRKERLAADGRRQELAWAPEDDMYEITIMKVGDKWEAIGKTRDSVITVKRYAWCHAVAKLMKFMDEERRDESIQRDITAVCNPDNQPGVVGRT